MDDDLTQTRKGVAALALALAKTIEDVDPDFRRRFVSNLSAEYTRIRDMEEAGEVKRDLAALEMLGWVLDGLKARRPQRRG